MIFKLTHRLGRIMFLFFLLQPLSSLYAQIILTPTSFSETMDQIELLYGDLIEIPMYEVKEFLDEQISGENDNGLSPPKAAIEFVNNEVITFSWDAVTSAENYTSRFLHLKTGEQGSQSNYGTSATLEMPNGLYMYTFQANSGIGKGPTWIIIEDKPLAMVRDLNGCDCKSSEVLYEGGLEAGITTLLDYSTGSGNDNTVNLISVELNFLDSDNLLHQSHFTAGLNVSAGNLSQIILALDEDDNEACKANIYEDEGSHLFAVTEEFFISPSEENMAARFDFNDGAFKILGYPNVLGNLFVTKCLADKPHPSDSKFRLSALAEENKSVFPNPTRAVVSLDTNTFDMESKDVFIRNSIGQILNLAPQFNDQNFLSFDLSPYPNGTYYLHIQKSGGVGVYPIVKLE